MVSGMGEIEFGHKECTCKEMSSEDKRLMSELEMPIRCGYCLERLWTAANHKYHLEAMSIKESTKKEK